MINQEIQSVMVVGIDTVSIAKSAKEAGYEVYAADYFGDVDLRRVCSRCEAIVIQKEGKSCGKIESRFKPEKILRIAESLIETHKIDGILISSGLDDSFDVLYKLDILVPILGNPPKVVERVRKKPEFFEELKVLGIDYPETVVVESLDESEVAADKIGYPVVVKPFEGFGGSGIRMARDDKEMEKAFLDASSGGKRLLVQKFIDGIHASISFLATDKGSEALVMSEQLLGLSYLFQQEPFGYCGNIVPSLFSDSVYEKCRSMTKKIAYHFGLKGSNGIDFIINGERTPYVAEINPRFQGTLECVNRVLGINLVESHINACLNSSLPTVRRKPSIFCTRLILHAPKSVVVPNLEGFREVRDVPLPGTIIGKGEPFCSVLTEGESPKVSFEKARKLTESVYGMIRPA